MAIRTEIVCLLYNIYLLGFVQNDHDSPRVTGISHAGAWTGWFRKGYGLYNMPLHIIRDTAVSITTLSFNI